MPLLKAQINSYSETVKTSLVLESFTIGPVTKDVDKPNLIAQFVVVERRGTNPDTAKTATRKQVIRDLSVAGVDPAVTAAVTTLCNFAKAAYDADNPVTP